MKRLVNAPGIWVWLAVWLLVTAVPLWRLRAARQWRQSEVRLTDPIYNPPVAPLLFGITPPLAHQLGRRWPDDLDAQLTALELGDGRDTFYGYKPAEAPVGGAAHAQSQARRLARYALLARRFPHSNALRAARLIEACNGPLPLESSALLKSYGITLSPDSAYLPRAQRQSALQIARQGAASQPDNAFWPWMEAVLLFSLRRDDAAIQALARAARCSKFDDFTGATAARRRALLGRTRAVDATDEVAILWGVNVPHLAKMRAAARAAMWRADELQKRGDRAGALQIMADVQGAGAALARARTSTFQVLVGQAVQKIAWHSLLKSAGRAKPTPNVLSPAAAPGIELTPEQEAESQERRDAAFEYYYRDEAQKVAAYARELNQPAIAQQTLAALPQFKSSATTRAWFTQDPLFQRAARLTQLHALGAWLLILSLVGALLWLLAWAMTRRNVLAPSLRRSGALWSALALGITLALLGFAASHVLTPLAPDYFTGPYPSPEFDAPQFTISHFLLFALSAVWLAPLLLMALGAQWKRLRANSPRLSLAAFGVRGLQRAGAVQVQVQVQVMRALVAALWWIGFAVSSYALFLWDAQAVAAPEMPSLLLLISIAPPVFVACNLILGARAIATTRGLKRARAALLWAGLFAFAASEWALALRLDPRGTDQFAWGCQIAVTCLAAALLLWLLEQRKLTLGDLAWSFAARLRLLSGALALASALLYLALNLGLVPLQSQTRAVVDRQIKVGEVAFVEEQTGGAVNAAKFKLNWRSLMNDSLVVALDIGTSSVRALAFDAAGRKVGAEAQIPYSQTTTANGGVEIDADFLLDLLGRCLDQLLPTLQEPIGAVAISCFWHSLLAVDAPGAPQTAVISWADNRAAAWVSSLRRVLDEDECHARLGCVFHTSYWPAKLLWLRDERPELFKTPLKWMGFGEYLGLKWCGESRVSLAMASGTGLFDQNKCQWDDAMVSYLPISCDQLPPFDAELPPLGSDLATRWPSLKDARWFSALGDGACSNIGSGCANETRIGLNAGTSGALRVVLRDFSGAPPRGLWRYRVDERRSIVGGALSNAGNVLDWARATFRVPDDWQTRVAALKPDAHGLTILPFLAGERAPIWNGNARFALEGAGWDTDPTEIMRAVTEGAALRFAAVGKLLLQLAPDAEIVFSGGVLEGIPPLQPILCDALGAPLTGSREHEASARGAALLALERCGVVADVADVPFERGETLAPNQANHAIYSRALERQNALYGKIYG